MSTVFRHLGSLPALLVGVVGLLTMNPRRAGADGPPPVYLWGINRNVCKVDEALSDLVAARLQRMGERVERLQLNPGSDIHGCTGKECADRLRLACPKVSGILLGGYLEERKVRLDGSPATGTLPVEETWQRVSLWRFDLATNQALTRSFACKGCSPEELVARHAAELIEQPGQESQSLVCPGATLGSFLDDEIIASEAERLTLVLTAGSKDRRGAVRAITEALKHHVRMTGREVLVDDNRHGQALAQLRSRRPGQHLLEVALKNDGEVQLQFWEQSARDPSSQKLECFGCTDDDLAHRVAMTAGTLLDTCYSQSCRSAPQSVMQYRSSLICAPINPPADCEPPPLPVKGDDVAAPPSPPPPDFLSTPCGRMVAAPRLIQPIVTVGLQPPPAQPEQRRRRMSTAGKIMLTVGAVSAAAMIGVVAANKQPGIGQCADASSVYADKGCIIDIRPATPLAAVTGSLGGSLLIAGGTLLGLASRSQQPSTR